MSQSNKNLVQKAHEILKSQGHEIPLGHVYELFAKLSGYNDWNTAKAAQAEFRLMSEKEISRWTVAKMLYQENKKIMGALKDRANITVSLVASATVRFQQSYELNKNKDDLTEQDFLSVRQKFISDIHSGKIDDAAVVEPPVVNHDYNGIEDVELVEVQTYEERQKERREILSFMPSQDVYQHMIKLMELEEIEQELEKAE